MTRVRYTRRIGQHPAGAVRDLRPSAALQLVRQGFATYEQQPAKPEQAPADDDQDTTQQPATDESDTKTTTLADLKARAEELGVATYGTKAQLMDRIDQAEQARTQQDAADEDDTED